MPDQLISCRRCGGRVSSHARFCPGCAAPISPLAPARSHGLAPLQWVGIGILTLIVAAGCEGVRRGAENPQPPAPARAANGAEVLPCGHPRRLLTNLGKPLPERGVAYCADEKAHEFRERQGAWVPAPELDEIPIDQRSVPLWQDNLMDPGPHPLEKAIKAAEWQRKNQRY